MSEETSVRGEGGSSGGPIQWGRWNRGGLQVLSHKLWQPVVGRWDLILAIWKPWGSLQRVLAQ